MGGRGDTGRQSYTGDRGAFLDLGGGGGSVGLMEVTTGKSPAPARKSFLKWIRVEMQPGVF